MKARKLITCLLLVAMVAALGTAAVFAADEPEAAEQYGLEESFLRKDLNVADDVDISKANTFTFVFTAENDSNGDKSPAIADQTVTVGAQKDDLATGAIKLSDFIKLDMFKHAGEYVWTVAEKQDTPTAPVLENGTATLTMDNSSYTLRVYVINTADGKLAFQGVTVEKAGKKVDPTETETHQKSEFLFENTLKEVVGDDDVAALTVTKTISGTYANMEKTFPITVAIEIPGEKVASQKDVVLESGEINWTDNTHATVTADLGNNGTIVFTSLPAGTTFTVSETQDSNYMSKTTGFVSAEDESYVAGNVSKTGAGSILEAGKEVKIDNQRNDLVPTGVIVDNLPYVVLVLVAAAGVAYLTLKKKAHEA